MHIFVDYESSNDSIDYPGVFLPNLVPPENCKDKDGTLNKPLCIAWSSSGRNHYIALVGVKGRPVPKLPNWMFPKAWGVPQELIPSYIDMDDQGRVEIGGDKCLQVLFKRPPCIGSHFSSVHEYILLSSMDCVFFLQDKYILKLVSAMEKVFESKNQVRTSLVADYHQYVFKNTGRFTPITRAPLFAYMLIVTLHCMDHAEFF